MSRQVERRELFEQYLRVVNDKHLKMLPGENRFGGMLRSERRNLARAYAAGDWKRSRTKEQTNATV